MTKDQAKQRRYDTAYMSLVFHLQQQRLIELIRAGQIEEALQFAQEYLAPQGEENVRGDQH